MARRSPTRKRRARPSAPAGDPAVPPSGPTAPTAPEPPPSRLAWFAFALGLASGTYTPWRAISLLQALRDTAAPETIATLGWWAPLLTLGSLATVTGTLVVAAVSTVHPLRPTLPLVGGAFAIVWPLGLELLAASAR